MSREMLFAFNPEAARLVLNGKCSDCKELVNPEDFHTPIEIKEFDLSGMCGKCQRKFFKNADQHHVTDNMCPVCGNHEKAEGGQMCWYCWRGYKYFGGDIEQFKLFMSHTV